MHACARAQLHTQRVHMHACKDARMPQSRCMHAEAKGRIRANACMHAYMQVHKRMRAAHLFLSVPSCTLRFSVAFLQPATHVMM